MSEPSNPSAASGVPADAAPKPAPPTSRRRRSQSWKEQPSIWFVLLALCLVVLAGGGTPVWARAFVLIVTGLWVLMRPPTETPSRIFEYGVLALMVVALASSFVPVSWLGRMHWRADAQLLGIVLPKTNATAPWLALEAFAQLLAGVAWLYACWNLRLNSESRRHALWGLAGLTAALAVGSVIGNLLKLKYPLGREAAIFSYFPNRNQAALWFCLGGLAAFGVLLEGLRRRRGRSLLAGGLLLPCLLALVMGRSRMAMGLFVLGAVLVVVVRLGRDAGNYAVRVLIPLGIFLASLLVFYGEDTIQRLETTSQSPEFRLKLWHDTLHLVSVQPVGVGLGQFADVYPQYRFYAMAFQSVRHPDSDWMWLLGETGWLGVLAAAVAVGGLVVLFTGRAGRASGPYRHLAALCAGLFLLHSLVDVPAHRFGTWLLAAWLLTVAAPDTTPVPTRIPRWGWRGVGVALLVIGGLWLAAEGGLSTNATLAEAHAQSRANAAMAKGDASAALVATNEAIALEPLLWSPYFQRARTELTLQNNRVSAQADFRRARFLEPTWAQIPYAEGVLWLPYNPALAFAAWREAVQRQDNTPEGLWREIYEHLSRLPNGDDYASTISKTRPVFRFQFLIKVGKERFAKELSDDLVRDPKLAAFNQEQRLVLLERWAGVDGGATLKYLKDYPHSVPNDWLVSCYALASTGRVADAYNQASHNLLEAPVPKLPFVGQTDAVSLKSSFTANPRNMEFGTMLVHAQLDAEDFDGALVTLTQMTKLAEPPPFVSWWRANLLARAGRMDEAWKALQPYIEYQRRILAKKP